MSVSLDIGLTIETFFRAGWDEARLIREIELWDATTGSHIARCPRYGEYSICYGLREKGEGYQLSAGSALHAALAAFYSGLGVDECMALLASTWGHDGDWRLPSSHRYQHLHLGHLEVIFKNYMDHAKKRDTFRPLVIKREKLNLDRVIAGWWQVTPDGNVILGEAKFIMEFELKLPTGETVTFHYSGRPDLPIEMGGANWMMDHKSTSAYLSSWWGETYKHSNQLRGYCAMLESLTGLRLSGGLINGVYVGEKAVSTEFKGSRFERYGPFSWSPAHLSEALLNQYYWKQELFRCYDQKFFPQNTGKACQSCNFNSLCQASPSTRVAAMDTDFVRSELTPMDNFLRLI